MTEALPRGWASAQLSVIGRWLGGGTPSKSVSQYWKEGTVHWVSPKDMKRLLIDSAQDQITDRAVKESATNLVPRQSVLMVTRSGILEHSFPVAVNTIPVAINQDLKAWTPLNGIDPIYVAYFLKCHAHEILDRCSKDGTTVSSIDFDRLAAYEIVLAPRTEQRRIVSKIDELFSRIDEGERALERVQALIKRYRQSVLRAAVTGELTREWREQRKGQLESGAVLLQRILNSRRDVWEKGQLEKMNARGIKPADDKWKRKYQDAALPSTSELPELPEGWAWASVEQVGEVRLGRQRAPQHHFGEHMRPYLRVANVYEDRLDLSDVMEMNFTPEEFATYELRRGDVLLNEGQSPELVGRPAMYRGEVPGCCYQKTLLRFRSRNGIRAEFALFVFRSYLHSGRFRRSANITTSIAHLAAERFVVIEFPVPSEDEQLEIVERATRKLSVISHLESELDVLRRAVPALRQSVLTAAFSGNLVAPDPTDESAAILLERITKRATSNEPSSNRGQRARKETAA